MHDLECLDLSRTRVLWDGNKSIQHGLYLGHSYHHPKLSVSIFKVKVIQGYEVKEISN